MTTAEALIAAAPPPEEDYIDMELSSSPSSNLFPYSIGSPPPPPSTARDFEFQIQMTSLSGETEPTNSPADELFYKGKLLPLHLPPRLQMVQKLTHSQNPSTNEDSFLQNFQIPFIAIKAPPSEFCNFSPTESCRPSCELNPDEYLSGFKEENPSRKSWSKKVKQLKQSSQAYFKALFTKSAKSEETESVFENRGRSGKFMKGSKKFPFGRIDYNKWLEKENSEEFYHRRSFSGAISSSINNKSSSGSSCSSTSSSGSSSLSSSFSFSSKGFSDLQLFKRSISANSEIESSIEGAIAHCKQSQKKFGNLRKNEVESYEATCSISASKVLACGDQKSSNFCRI